MKHQHCRLIAVALVVFVGLVAEAPAEHVDIDNIDEYESPLVLLPPIEWTGIDFSSRKEREKFNALSSSERDAFGRELEVSPRGQAYFHGVLETFGYFVFTNFNRTPENEQLYSDFRVCAETRRSSRWYVSGWLSGDLPRSTLAFGLVTLGFAFGCDGIRDDGDGQWVPLDLGTQLEWQNYSEDQRKFYVGAFIETIIEMNLIHQETGHIPPNDRTNQLIQCMTDNGFEKILKTLRGMEIDLKLPLPWTVSEAVEKVCAR